MWLYSTFKALRPVFGLYWRFRLENPEAVPDGPFIAIVNHQSFIDPWYIIVMLPRPVRFVVNRNWFYKSRFWEGFFRAHSAVPLAAGTPDDAMEELAELLSRGDRVAIFPEGKICNDGRLQRFRSGVAYLAAKTGVPVLPLGLEGAFESLPRSRRFPKPATITLRVGQPIRFPGSPCKKKPSRRSIVEFRDRLHAEVRELCGEAEPAPELAATEADGQA